MNQPGSKHVRPLRILIAAEGSEGDNRPPVAVGKRLLEQGHLVKACVPRDYVSFYKSHGIDALPMGFSTWEFFLKNSGSMFDRNISGLYTMFRLFSDYLDTQFPLLYDLVKDADVIYASGFIFAAGSVAEKYGKPVIHTVHAPVFFPSAYIPPPNFRFITLPGIINRALWKVFITAFNLCTMGPVNRWRECLGLKKLRTMKEYLLNNMVLAMDPELAPLSPDNRHVIQTGYPRIDDSHTLSPEIEAFLHSGPPPVFIGFGSMLTPRPDRIVSIVLEAIRKTGNRAVLYTHWTGRERYVIREKNIITTGHTPHSLLFPRMTEIVHHGGAGTTHSAAIAGVPQIIVPHLIDQYYFGHRVYRLGLGPSPVPRQSLSVKRLCRALEAIREDPGYYIRAKEMSDRLKQRDGTGEIVDIIKECAKHG
ncbi:MAG: glycosyltransferase family 1 protein [Spirochaetales bacterium]|nr:glycosyltransferase family 1 protein [Spirochaetales bacterium]